MLKKFFAVGLIVVSPSLSFAWESPKNPDRFPSLGLSYSGGGEAGEYKVSGFKQDLKTHNASLLLDTRLPLSDSFTLSLGIGATATNVKGEENSAFNASESDTSGGFFTISGRYYFNR